MDSYIRDWIKVIEEGDNNNNYKPCWGRAVIECIMEEDYSIDPISGKYRIDFKSIAYNMLRYYWNQRFFFSLRQGPRVKESKGPLLYQDVEKMIEEYIRVSGNNLPCWADLGFAFLKKENPKFFEDKIRHSATVLNNDVCYRFLIVNQTIYDLYVYNKEVKNEILFTREQIDKIKDASGILNKLLNYRWAELLDKFNVSPRILEKVHAIAHKEIERENLSPYRKILIKYLETENPLDFYSGNILLSNDISVDHVIPWSFIYRDDIWNLVLTDKSTNSKKSNHKPKIEDIERLEKRNNYLISVIEDKDEKYKKSLVFARDENLLRKFYYEFTI